MALVDWLFIVLLIVLPGLFFLLIICQHFLGWILSREYDPHFFKEPYFTSGEIAVYRSWPLSLLRFATYILFTAYPRTLQDRRFKGDPSPYAPGIAIKFSCRLWVLLLLACIVATPLTLVLLFLLPG